MEEATPTIFEFVSYKFEPQNKRIFFSYKQNFENRDPINFTETLILPTTPELDGISQELLNKILQGVHIAIGVSYYKCYCSQKIKLNYSLAKKQADFWNVVYKKGLGEFYYRNNLNPKISPKFSFDKKAESKVFSLEKNNKCLVSISGGKDSIVAAELLKEQNFDITAVFTETQKESELVNKVIEISELKSLKFRRVLDAQVFERHKYNGHVPVSAIYAFLGILYCLLYRHSYCVMANEFSSNFGNIKYKDIEINHQWSKSSEFENMFSDYVNNFITKDIKYFSLLRPFYEIRIVEMFSQYKKYFPYFSSCNKNFKINGSEIGWCGECPKCVFVWTLLSAFLKKEELIKIFNKNLYQDKNLLPLFKDVFGFGKIKPFDCVGTFKEAKTAFILASKNFKDDFIVRQLFKKVKIKKQEIKELFRAQQSKNIPSQFRFLGMKNVLILGLGKEGEVSKKYIEKKYPNLKIDIADAKQGRDYLKKQENFDIAIKTPGIKKDIVKIQYTTATNLFFAEAQKNRNKIIGITGSKGKSTTASLIYEILKEAGKNVKLLGNIGYPMLEVFLEPVEKDKIFVVELSSYQLDDIDFSSDVAVLTNLFPEHMDYHGTLKNYYEAKKNIFKFQDKNGIFIAEPFASGFLNGVKIPLIGEHNKKNILLAVAVAKKLFIEDKAIKTAIEKFKPLPHRLEFVGEFKGIKFYDDAISTTPESTIEAIKALTNVDTIFLGGQDRGYKFLQLEKIIKKYKINNAVLFPESGNRIKLKGVRILKTKSMKEAVRFAFKNTASGKICLLSCASPSYSLWKNFEEKGMQFQKFVKELSNEKTF